MREAASPGHTRLLLGARRILSPSRASRASRAPCSVREARRRELPETEPARRRRTAERPAPEPPEREAASPRRRRRRQDLSARRGRTGDEEAPGRDQESLGGGGGERTPGPPVAAAGPGRAAHAGSPGDQPRPSEGAPAAPALASSLCPGGGKRERATRRGPAVAAAPPSPALSAPPGAAADAAAASSAPTPPPPPRKSPPRTWAPGSAGGKTRESRETPGCAGLKLPNRTFLWIKKYIYAIFCACMWAEEKESKTRKARKGKQGTCNSWMRLSTPQTSCATFVNIFCF